MSCIYENENEEIRICGACGEEHAGGLTAKEYFDIKSDEQKSKLNYGGWTYHPSVGYYRN